MLDTQQRVDLRQHEEQIAIPVHFVCAAGGDADSANYWTPNIERSAQSPGPRVLGRDAARQNCQQLNALRAQKRFTRRRGVRGVKTLLGLGLSCKLLGRKLLDTHKASRVFRVTAPIRRVIRQWSLAQIRGKDRVQLNTEKPDTGSTLGDKFPTCSLRSTEGKASLGEGVLTVRIGAANLAGAFVCLCRVQEIEV